MFRFVFALCLMAIMSSSGQCKTLKRRRDAGSMPSDYVSDEYLYDYADSDGRVTGFYDVKYDKKFNSDWLDPSSNAFSKEARKVGNALIREVSAEFNVPDADVKVVVDNFIPGSTRAQVRISISDYFGVTVDAITAKMNTLVSSNFRIGRSAVLEVADLNTPISPAGTTAIIFELTYRGDNRAQEAALNDTRSRAFEVLSSRIASQLELLLLEPLQTISGLVVTPEMMETTVLKITPDGFLTKAEIELHVDNVPTEDVSTALRTMTDSDNSNIRIDGGLVIGLDELDRVFISPDDDGSGAVYEPEDSFYPDEYGVITGEVMEPKDLFIGNVNNQPPNSMLNDGAEPTPPPLEPLTTESTTTTTRTQPPYRGEPTPPGNCDRYGTTEPRHGTVKCSYGNEIGSSCQFTCNEDTQMVGTDTIRCGFDGNWNEDPPYCNRLHCQPPIHQIGNGTVSCSHSNRFKSSCDFTCDDGFTLNGEATVTCQRSEEWTGVPSTCEMIPVNCEEEYRQWTQCFQGKRRHEAVRVRRGSIYITCPDQVEECADCELEWGDWSTCVDGVRSRTQFVKQEKIGSGKECNAPEVQREECVQCELVWGEWGDCTDESTSRSQVIRVEPVGYKCPEVQTETKACKNCEVGWTEWGKCTNGVTTRSTVVTVQPQGVGRQCPELASQQAECADCVVEWSDWSTCINGESVRQEQITQERVGEGKVCPELRTQTEKCADCEVQWADWGPCLGGLSRRVSYVVVDQVGVGAACPHLPDDSQACAECGLEWTAWSNCDGAFRTRTQRIWQRAINVEEPCPELQKEIEPCSDCTYEWSDWSECDFGTSTRNIRILSEATGAGKACPTNTTQTKDCCFLVWGSWSECESGERVRMEEIISQPTGETCRDGDVEVEECNDCSLEWGNWSECTGGVASRSQVVIQPAVGGKACPDFQKQVQHCTNCVVQWGSWEECRDGERTRQQIIVTESSLLGTPCPELMQVETEDCNDCVSNWGQWQECSNGVRTRVLNVVQEPVGAGEKCPSERLQSEACADCEVEWGPWSGCSSNERQRSQVIRVAQLGAGRSCPSLQTEFETCADCEVEWGPWSGCSSNQRQRSQVIRVAQLGAGRSCPSLQTEFETCIDCVVEWGAWTACFGGVQSRRQYVKTAQDGAGRACPELLTDKRDCEGSPAHFEKLVCRFVDTVLGFKRKPSMRDLLLIGDESGSIGRINFEKIKTNFKSIAKDIRGGVGSQENQVAMSSFALYGRMHFDFDDHQSADEVVAAIDKTYYTGGYRSRIGNALEDANRWLFQQASGMRSFPDLDDNIEHEILIVTDGCRTQDIYHLKQGLKTIKNRGIKLYVLGIATRDKRCRKTIDAMVEDQENLFMLGSWAELDDLSHRLDDGVCQTDLSSPTTAQPETTTEEEDVGSGYTPPRASSRGDSAGVFSSRAKRDVASGYKLGEFDQ